MCQDGIIYFKDYSSCSHFLLHGVMEDHYAKGKKNKQISKSIKLE